MTTPAKPIHVPAGLPIDEATRPELIDTGAANVQNRNVRMYETGALEKRLGTLSQTTSRSDGTSRIAGRKLFDHKGRVCVYDGDIVDELSPTLGVAVSRNKVPEAHFTVRDLPSASFDARVADTVYCNGFLVVLQMRQAGSAATDWEYSTCILEAVSGTIVRSLEVVKGPGAIHGVGLATFGDKVVFGVCDQTLAQVQFSSIDLSNAAGIETGWSSLTNVAEAGTSGQLAMSSGTDRFYAAWDNGSNAVKVRALNATGVIQSKDFATTSAPSTDTICLSENGDVLWVGWHDGGGGAPGVSFAALNLTTITTVVGAPAVVFTASAGDLNKLFVVATGPQLASFAANDITLIGSAQPKMHVRALRISAGTVNTTSTYIPLANAEMTARPFVHDGRTYGWFTSYDGDACVLCDWTITSDHVWLRPVVAPVDRGLVDHPANRTNVQSRTVTISSTKMLFAFATKRTGISSGVLAVTIDFADREIGNSVYHHGVTFLSAGVTSVYDGDVVAEAGFLAAPTTPSFDTSLAGAVTLTSGGRNYVAIYSWTDAVGNVHLSGVSPTSGLTGNIAAKKIVITVGGIALANERPIDILVYATRDGGEPPYYLVGSVANDPEGAVTVTDNSSDATLTARAKLYAPQLPGTVGEALDRRAPTGLRNLVSYAGMLCGTVGGTLVFSGQEVSGEGTWFSPIFEVPMGPDLTGLRAQDGYLVTFTENTTSTISGESPSDNGAAGGFGASRLVSADYGCLDANSIVATSLGIFFQSARGIEIFSRAQSVEWIGEPVVDTLTDYPNVTSAVVDARNTLVRFTLAADISDGVVSGEGRDLVFDLSVKAWVSVDDRTSNEAAQHAAYVDVDGRRWAWLGSDGVVHTERDRGSSKECRDDDAWVTSQYTPAHWRLGLQQDQRVFEMLPLFERESSAGITIEVAENYGAFGAVTADKVWTSAFLDARSDRKQVWLRTRENGFATQLRLRDTAPTADPGTDSGRGITWIGISADIGPKQGTTRGTPAIAEEMRR